MNRDLQVILKFILDKKTLREVESGAKSVSEALDSIGSKNLDAFIAKGAELASTLDKITKKYQEQKREVEDLKRLSSSIGQMGAALTAAGAAITGPIILSARNYVKFMEQAGNKNDEVTDRWLAAQRKIENAQLNIGRVMATTVVPYLERAATIVERVASYVNQNPEAVEAIFGAGVGLTILGALTLAVSKGIKIYADFKYIAATAEFTLATASFQASVREFLGGTLAMKTPNAAVGGAGVGGLGQVLSVGTIAVSEIILAVAATNALLDAIGAPRLQEMAKAQFDFIKDLGKVFSGDMKLNELAAQVVSQAQAAADARKATEDLNAGLRDYVGEAERAANAAEGMKIVKNLETTLADQEYQYQQRRESIIRSANNQISNAYRNHSRAMSRIGDDLERTLGRLETDYYKSSIQSERDYNEQRADIIKNSGEQVLQIERNLQEELRKLRLDHEDRVAELAASRDALGLVKERRRYEREVSERERAANIQIAEQRRETAMQLEELRIRHERERQLRYQQYQEQMQEAIAQAEVQKEIERQNFADQLSDIRRNKAQQLAELDRAHKEETRRAVTEAYNQVKQLDGALLAERVLRQKYYAIILGDANDFMGQYANALSAGANVSMPSRQSGGYLYKTGAFKGHEGEYVMKRSLTQAAEKAVGGRLNESNLMAALAGRRNGGTTVNLEFPGGLVTVPMLKDILENNGESLIQGLAGALG